MAKAMGGFVKEWTSHVDERGKHASSVFLQCTFCPISSLALYTIAFALPICYFSNCRLARVCIEEKGEQERDGIEWYLCSVRNCFPIPTDGD